MTKTRLLLADDHRIVMDGMKTLLDAEFSVVGMVEDGRALLEAEERLRPDVVVSDISLPLLNGIDAAKQMLKARKGLKVVILTMHSDPAYAAAAFDAGVSGFVLKHSAASELLEAVRAALQGRTYVTPLIGGELMRFYKARGSQPNDDAYKITPRQREVLQLLAEGRQAKEIASILGISPRTVEFHKYQMMEGLNVKSTVDLIRVAVRNRLVDE